MTLKSVTYIGTVREVEDCFLIHFPDLPECRTFVNLNERHKAGEVGVDCLRTALIFRKKHGEEFPEAKFDGKGTTPSTRLVVTISLEGL